MSDRTLIFSVFIVASCGLAYELIAGALASYLLAILSYSFRPLLAVICLPWALARI
jgi:spermidine synthase